MVLSGSYGTQVSIEVNLGETMKSLIFATLLSIAVIPPALTETMTLTVQSTSGVGSVQAAVFANQTAFDAGQPVGATMSPADEGQTVLTIKDLTPGKYGIAVFHDLNGNEELDRNAFGAPNEPFGFSNDPKIGFSAPKFEAFEFEFDGSPKAIVITLN